MTDRAATVEDSGHNIDEGDLLSTEEAAGLLGVKQSTIYTYVSRGRLESIRKPGQASSWFRRSDLERLAETRRPRKEGGSGEAAETTITELTGYEYRYRGVDPHSLLESHTFEQVAEFLWTGSFPSVPRWQIEHSPTAKAAAKAILGIETLPLDRLRVAVAALAARDPLRFGRQHSAIVITARQLIGDMVESLPRVGEKLATGSIAGHLWQRLTDRSASSEHIDALNRALIVIADHGIAPSTLAARIAATYRADLYGAVGAGLSIIAGAWHGGRALSAETMIEDIETTGDAETVIGELYRQGGIPCLGQPRYRIADPRTRLITDAVAAAEPNHPALAAFSEVRRIVEERGLPQPSVELGLATMSRTFEFIKGGAELVFAVGRTAGWIAHAMEMYARPAPSSPESHYAAPVRSGAASTYIGEQ